MPTVLQWARHLESRILDQTRYAEPFEARYRGRFILPFIEREYREVYGPRVDALSASLDPPRTGIAAIGVDALVERLTVTGVESRDPVADRDAVLRAERAWEDCDLDVMHREAHREALIKARSFGLVTRSADGRAVASVQAPEQMAVHRTPGPPYDVDAALRPMVDEWTGRRTAALWVGDREFDLVEMSAPLRDPEAADEWSRWRVVDNRPAHLGRPPVVEFSVRPRLLAEPESDIAQVASLVDIADLIEGLMVFAGHFGAVPIRYATGLPVPRDPSDPTRPLLGADGKPVIGFDARADRLWTSTDADTKFGQLEPAGLASFVVWADHLAARIRAKTAIASTYYSVDLKSHMNAELLKTDEAPMIRRILALGRDGTFGQAWRRMLWMIDRTERPGSQARLRPRWADPETRVEAQATDSFQKVVASGLGVRVAAQKILGWPPELVEQAVAEAEAAAQQAAMMAEGLGAATGAGGDSLGFDVAAIKDQADAAGVLIRAGVEARDALETVGLEGLELTGAVPTSLRLPEADARRLES